VVLVGISLMALAACGGKAPATTAGSTPPASGASAPTADSASSAPSSSAPAGNTGDMSDRELCEAANKAGNAMKDALMAFMKSGREPSAADYKKILTDLGEQLTTLASSGGDTTVATALKQLGAQASKAAGAADPASAIDNPVFDKAGDDLTAACAAAGVDVNV